MLVNVGGSTLLWREVACSHHSGHYPDTHDCRHHHQFLQQQVNIALSLLPANAVFGTDITIITMITIIDNITCDMRAVRMAVSSAPFNIEFISLTLSSTAAKRSC